MTRKPPAATEPAALMTVNEVATMLNVHRTTVYKQLLAKGHLHRVGIGRKTQIARAEVEAYIAAAGVKKAS